MSFLLSRSFPFLPPSPVFSSRFPVPSQSASFSPPPFPRSPPYRALPLYPNVVHQTTVAASQWRAPRTAKRAVLGGARPRLSLPHRFGNPRWDVGSRRHLFRVPTDRLSSNSSSSSNASEGTLVSFTPTCAPFAPFVPFPWCDCDAKQPACSLSSPLPACFLPSWELLQTKAEGEKGKEKKTEGEGVTRATKEPARGKCF